MERTVRNLFRMVASRADKRIDVGFQYFLQPPYWSNPVFHSIRSKVLPLPADLRSVPRWVFINEWSGDPVTNFGSKPAKKVSSKTLQTPKPNYSKSEKSFFNNLFSLLNRFLIGGYSLARRLL